MNIEDDGRREVLIGGVRRGPVEIARAVWQRPGRVPNGYVSGLLKKRKAYGGAGFAKLDIVLI